MVITPDVLPVIVCVKEFTLPVIESDVPVATPKTGVTNVGEVCNTTLPLPVAVVEPVPPFKIGNAVPDNVTANVPEDVIGEPATERNEGTVNAMLVTVPVVGVVQVIAALTPPALVNTCPLVPEVVGKLKLYVPDADCPCIVIDPEIDPFIILVVLLNVVNVAEFGVPDPIIAGDAKVAFPR